MKVFQSEVRRQGRTPEASRPRVEVQAASDIVASQLQLETSAQVISQHQERRIDGTPWSLQITFYPMEFVVQGATRLLMAESISGGVAAYLREHLGINQVGWRETIIARRPREYEQAFFGLSDKVQAVMFELRRTGYDEDGKPIQFTVTIYPADRNQFELEAGRVPPSTAGTVTGESQEY